MKKHLTAWLMLMPLVLEAQTPAPQASVLTTEARPAFEVASVKPSDPTEPRTIQFSPTTLTIRNVPLATVVVQAYSIPPQRLSFGPFFTLMTGQGYDIAAKAAGPVSGDQMRLMLQSLLAARFHLAAHLEQKVVDVYALTAYRDGPKLQPAAADEKPDFTKELSPEGVRSVKFTNSTLKTLASLLTEEAASNKEATPTTVVDKTGLLGGFDFALTWTRDSIPTDGTPQDPLSPIGAALHKIGLTLNKDKSPIDYLVIDHIDKAPSEN